MTDLQQPKSLVRLYVELAQRVLTADDVETARALAEAAAPDTSIVLPQDWHIMASTLVAERQLAGRVMDAWCPFVVARQADVLGLQQQRQQLQQGATRRVAAPPRLYRRKRRGFDAWCAKMADEVSARSQAPPPQQQQQQQQAPAVAAEGGAAATE